MSFASNVPNLTLPIILATAAGYALATVGMKSVAVGSHPAIGVVIAVIGFGLAFLAEILLMRRFDVSVVYISIIATETVLVLAWAHYIGEGLGLRQLLGALFVVGGIALVTR